MTRELLCGNTHPGKETVNNRDKHPTLIFRGEGGKPCITHGGGKISVHELNVHEKRTNVSTEVGSHI